MNKATTTVMVALTCAFAWASGLSQDAWRAKVGDAAQSAAVMKSTISQVVKAEQCAFVKAVNAAIGKMPSSKAEKAQRYIDVNRAAVQGADADNRSAVLAEIFAVVPVDFLPGVEENFATSLFDRKAQKDRTFTDAEFTEIADKCVGEIADRCSEADKPDVRTGFGILLFTRASGGTPADLPDLMAQRFISEPNRAVAKERWFPSALAEDATKTYGPMLGDNETERLAVEVEHGVVLPVSPQQLRDAFFADLASAVAESGGPVAAGAYASPAANRATDAGAAQVASSAVTPSIPKDKIFNETLPNGDPNPYYKKERGDKSSEDGPSPGPNPPPGPHPYDGQVF